MARLSAFTARASNSLTALSCLGIVTLPLTAPAPQPSLSSLRLLPEAEDAGPRGVRVPREPRPDRRKVDVRTVKVTVEPQAAAQPVAEASRAQQAPAPTPVVPPAVERQAAPEATSPPAGEQTTPTASAGIATKPDGWTDAQIRAALEDCLRLIGPISAEIDVAPAPKEGACGTPAALVVRAVGTPRVELHPPATMNCRMAAALHTWVSSVVQPAAIETFGNPVTRLNGTSAYVCRPRNGVPGEKLSEHAFANAVDVSGFGWADGREITVLAGWGPTARDRARAATTPTAAPPTEEAGAVYGPPKPPDLDKIEAKPSPPLKGRKMALGGKPPAPAPSPPETEEKSGQFLRRLHAGACGPFKTVLGPEANDFHRNHFHLDLADRKRGTFCE